MQVEAANAVENAVVFHAGTAKKGDQLVSSGGRYVTDPFTD